MTHGSALPGAARVQRPDGLAELPRAGRRAEVTLPPPLLLGAFDPLLLGWASREAIVGPHRQIVTVNGLFRPFALAGGEAVATWSFAGGKVTLAPFAPLGDQTLAALDTQAADVTRFLGARAGQLTRAARGEPPMSSREITARSSDQKPPWPGLRATIGQIITKPGNRRGRPTRCGWSPLPLTAAFVIAGLTGIAGPRHRTISNMITELWITAELPHVQSRAEFPS